VLNKASEGLHEESEGRGDREEGRAELETLAATIVDAGLKVHRALGPGLLESCYERCLVRELDLRGIIVDQQVTMPVIYEGMCVDGGYRLDMVVGQAIIIEIKAIEKILPIHEAQVLTYLKFAPYKTAFLMNFNTKLFKDGLKRFKK
jgi:GxxExxY protein